MPAPAASGRRDGHGQSISDIGAVRGLVLASKVEARRVTPEPLEEPRGSRRLSTLGLLHAGLTIY